MKVLRLPALLTALVVLGPVRAFSAGRPAEIQFSDGKVMEGLISLSRGKTFRIHRDNKLVSLELARVQEIRISPGKEKMEQKWRFITAGQTAKEKWGDPYPVRSLDVSVLLQDGKSVEGHLYTTVLYIEGKENTRKLVLYAKQRGKPGQSFESLVYPARVRFLDSAKATDSGLRILAKLPQLEKGAELVGLTYGALARLPARLGHADGEFFLPSPMGHPFFLAIRSGNRILAGWPASSDPKLTAAVQKALGDSRDFFDRKKLLGVYRPEGSRDIYSLMLLSRQGRTTLRNKKSQPWRVGILRWKYQEEDGRIMLAGRGYFFRGISAKELVLPQVELSNSIFSLKKNEDGYIINGE